MTARALGHRPGGRPVTAKPNIVEVFNGTGEKNYAYNAPYVVVAYLGPLSSDRLNQVNDLKVPVPWASDLRDSIREAERRAERYFAEDPYKQWADESGYYLTFGSGNTTVAVGHAKRLGDAWQPLHGQYGYTEADSSYLRLLDRPKEAFDKFCKEIADSQPPGFRQHPLADADVVTIYRGVTLGVGQDPTTSDKSDDGFGQGVGSSWTLDLSVAKAIAERKGAGFSGDNRAGRPQTVKAAPRPGGSTYNKDRPVVLRATVDLSQPGFGLLNDGRMYYSSEQEVDVRPGTEFTLTGYMEAEPRPVDPAKARAAIEKAEREVAEQGYSLEDYQVTYRWPTSWHGTKIKRVAALDTTDYEGSVGDRTHMTRKQTGTVPTTAVATMPGVKGEVPGEHRNKHGRIWEDFKADIAERGIVEPIFITVDYGEQPKISEGNHRRDAAVELGLSEVPVEVRYFGHAERGATVASRTAALDRDLLAFLFAEYRDPARSRGDCIYAARKFWDWASREGLEPRTLGFLGLSTNPDQEHAASAVRVDGRWVVVDFTLNQFDPDAPWPLVEPLEEYSARWGQWRVTRGRPIAAGHRPGGRLATALVARQAPGRWAGDFQGLQVVNVPMASFLAHVRPGEPIDAGRDWEEVRARGGYDDLREDIAEHGLRMPVLVDLQTNEVRDGHHRAAALMDLGASHVPVIDYNRYGWPHGYG